MGLGGLAEIPTQQLSWLPRELLLVQEGSELEAQFGNIAPYLRVKESRFFDYLRTSLLFDIPIDKIKFKTNKSSNFGILLWKYLACPDYACQ